MKRKIIHINEKKCNGCGICVDACQEGAIALVDGKAKLIREDYCDGLGNCLPACPTGAIMFEEREAPAFNEEAVKTESGKKSVAPSALMGCPGTRLRTLERRTPAAAAETVSDIPSHLGQWPCQIKLVPPNAPYLDNADLLIAADCTCYAFGNFHERFMKGKVTLIGCPKLDEENYADKLTAILKMNNIKSVTVVRMEVPCCAGIVNAVVEALRASGKIIPWSVTTIGIDGTIKQ